jgi:hypothetical protein
LALTVGRTTALVACACLFSALQSVADDKPQEFAFEALSEEELVSIEPTLHEQYFRGGTPNLYRRHRVVKIDTGEFKLQLQNAWEAKERGLEDAEVRIQLFEDRAAILDVESFQESDLGVAVFNGTLKSDKAFHQQFQAYFSDDGQLAASLIFEDAHLNIKYVRDYEHYVIMEHNLF